jgi:hypothetical protein
LRSQTHSETTSEKFVGGEELAEEEHGLVRTFIIKLECVYWQAVDTGHNSSFHDQDIYEDILQEKLPHLAREYAENRVEAETWSFLKFIDFLCQQNRASEICAEITLQAGLRSIHCESFHSIHAKNVSLPSSISFELCQGMHSVETCPSFVRNLPGDRIKLCYDNHLCLIRLSRNHVTAPLCHFVPYVRGSTTVPFIS